jgi:HD superfamily phosphodiesterase
MVAHLVDDEAESLICAAWLHDIGYAPGVTETGFHPLDGARYLRDIERAKDHICRLVAHHSYAIVEAQTRGLEAELVKEFPAVNGLVTDALTYCDMTTSPFGDSLTVEARINEISARYGPNDVVSVSIRKAEPRIIQSVRAITDRLSTE